MSRSARGCIVAPESQAWVAEHRPRIAGGPVIELGSNRLRFFDALGPMRDDATLADDIRLTRKSGLSIVLSKGILPFGASPSVRHSHRYSEGRLSCTSDWKFPRDTQIRDHFSVGCCELNTTPVRWRAIRHGSSTVEAGEWHMWPESEMSLPADTLAIGMEMGDGTMLELGLGEDLWRWRALAESQGADIARGFFLATGQAGAAIVRRTVAVAAVVTPPPRTWRFSWYATWQAPDSAIVVPTTPEPQRVAWWSDGSLDATGLQNLSSVLLDLQGMNLPSELSRNGVAGAAACISAAGVQRRLKHAIRQIHELTDESVPIVFTGWQPGSCCIGRHVGHKGERMHWDWPAMLDFCAWSRNLLGPVRQLSFGSDFPVMAADPFSLLNPLEQEMDDDELYP